jgi:undecaprenyl phosphate-alpha-L-ara4FN deformylase
VTPLRLRVDVCTYQGFRDGVPEVLRILRQRRARATFFVAMGPDSSGRAVFNLLKPSFARKMFRTNAAGSYGLATALYGTVLPAPLIGSGRPPMLMRILDEGHELGVHGWDHRRWQDDLDDYAPAQFASEFDHMCEAYVEATGVAPRAFAAPSWRVSRALLELEARHGFAFASDARGRRPFRPVFEGRPYSVPQVPVTLPTLDEALLEMDAAEFFRRTLVAANGTVGFKCLAVHAETEGRAYRREFADLLSKVDAPIGRLGDLALDDLPAQPMAMGSFPGRPFPICIQDGGPAA